MCQASDSNEHLPQALAPGPVPALEDRGIFTAATCGNCSNTEELIQKVVLGTCCNTQAQREGTNIHCLGLLGLEAEIRHVLALSKRPENEVSPNSLSALAR